MSKLNLYDQSLSIKQLLKRYYGYKIYCKVGTNR